MASRARSTEMGLSERKRFHAWGGAIKRKQYDRLRQRPTWETTSEDAGGSCSLNKVVRIQEMANSCSQRPSRHISRIPHCWKPPSCSHGEHYPV